MGSRTTIQNANSLSRTRTLAIDYRPVEVLIPFARNARTHDEGQVALIAGSIREYGFTNLVLVDGTNGIIARHGRVLAARKLELTFWGAPAMALTAGIGAVFGTVI